MRVGIDLGTTYSLVARLDSGGLPLLLPDRSFKDTIYTPSAVHLSGSGAFVGQAAERVAEQDPSRQVLRYFKRELGTRKALVYQDGTPWYPEAVSALVLKKLRVDAEVHAAQDVEGAVVTIPAHFDDVQRKATRAAALMADLPLLGLVEEPVAAALYYGVQTRERDRTLLVYDLGGGTFDATVLCVTDGVVSVLSKDGLTNLGGKEIDGRVGDMLLEQFRMAGVEPRRDQTTLPQLRRIAEEIKIDLCMPGGQSVRRMVLLGEHSAEVQVRRRAFEARIEDLLAQTETTLERCIAGAGLQREHIDTVLLVGGSSMIPVIQERMKRLFDQPHQTVRYNEPTKAVAMGAAMHAAQLSGDAARFDIPPELRGVTGHHLAVRAIDPRTGRVHLDTLIRKNMPLPAKATKTYYTTRPGQQRLMIELVQFIDAGHETALGNLAVMLPAERPVNYPIDVTMAYRNDGTVDVEARDPNTGETLRQTFNEDDPESLYRLATQQQLVRATELNIL